MTTLDLDDFDQELPDRLNLCVVMSKKPSSHPWADFVYQAVGVVADNNDDKEPMRKIHQDGEVEHYLFSGLSLQLHVDECESYYHNLMSPEPGCFIVADDSENEGEMPIPYLVSLSFDEAHAYLEGDQQVYSVEIPQQLYQWAEAFVLTRYVAIKKTKRKLKNWHAKEKAGSQAVPKSS
jgi:hypothetical protein